MLERAARPLLGEQPLVSIVTPSFNQGRFIRRTIDSVLAQTYPNIEYLVVDGGSTDETLDILRSYGDRVRWLSEPDAGQTARDQQGVPTDRTAKIVGYLNSDDVLLPDAIATVVALSPRTIPNVTSSTVTPTTSTPTIASPADTPPPTTPSSG